jgi:hypothetical protein
VASGSGGAARAVPEARRMVRIAACVLVIGPSR